MTKEKLEINIRNLRQEQGVKWGSAEYRSGYDQAISDVLALFASSSELKLDEDNYLWKWVERALFDKTNPMRDSLSIIAHHPSAPWEKGKWDVSHKPYAAEFYKAFPKAKPTE